MAKKSVLLFLFLPPLFLLPACKRNNPLPLPPGLTFTPTVTPACVATPWWTPQPTATPSGDYLTGTITYTGSMGPVDDPHAILVALYNYAGCWTYCYGQNAVTVNGGTYKLNAPGPGNYVFGAFYDVAGGGSVFTGLGNPDMVYNGACQGPGTSFNISGPTTLNLSFDDSCRIHGIGGTFSYTGSLGVVDSCHQFIIQIATDPAFTNLKWDIWASSELYGWEIWDFIEPLGTTYYVRGFYDHDSNVCPPPTPCISSGDPYKDFGPVTSGYVQTLNISVDDSQLWP